MGATRRLLRGHYNPTHRSRKYPNLQKTRLAGGAKVLICAQCLRTLAKPARKTKIKTDAVAATK